MWCILKIVQKADQFIKKIKKNNFFKIKKNTKTFFTQKIQAHLSF